MSCPCQLLETKPKSYEECCGPIHQGEVAKTPEQLMRARYSAYAKVNIPFISSTQITTQADDFNEAEAAKWAENSTWKGIKVLSTKKGGPEDKSGVVEFEAHYMDNASQKDLIHRETSLFEKVDGRWFFKEGNIHGAQSFKRLEPKVGRNDPCPCGSGKKYKKCCSL
jgi:SEC-C motif domain protein